MTCGLLLVWGASCHDKAVVSAKGGSKFIIFCSGYSMKTELTYKCISQAGVTLRSHSTGSSFARTPTQCTRRFAGLCPRDAVQRIDTM